MAKKKSPEIITIEDDDVILRPGSSPEAREQQMVNLAYNAAEKKLRDGTAADSTINYFLKLGSEREKKERLILEKQAVLLESKTDSIASAKNNEQVAKQALDAMKDYGLS